MGSGVAWAQRFDIIEAAIERGDLPDLRTLPTPISIEDVRAKVAADPPLEGHFIAERIFGKGNGFLYVIAVVCLVVVLANAVQLSHSHPFPWVEFVIGTVFSPFAALIFGLPLAAAAQPVTAWVLNTFVKPVDIDAATTRAFAVVEAERVRLESARSVWLWGGSLAAWRTADGPTFELLTARAFRKQGWKVEVVGGSNDGGVDLRLRRDGQLVLVQCKAHARPLSPAVVRELYGALLHERASSAILVCLSGVSKAAATWVADKPIQIMTPDQLAPLTPSVNKYPDRAVS